MSFPNSESARGQSPSCRLGFFCGRGRGPDAEGLAAASGDVERRPEGPRDNWVDGGRATNHSRYNATRPHRYHNAHSD